MAALSFHPVADGLYQAVGDGSAQIGVYWVLLDGSPPPGDLDPATTWTSYSGCHTFIPAEKPVPDLDTFADAVRGLFGPPGPSVRALAWIFDPAQVAGSAVRVSGVIGGTQGVAITGAELDVQLANVAFTASRDSQLSYKDSPPAVPGVPSIAIVAPSQAGIVGLVRQNQTSNLVPAGAGAFVPLGGPSAGAIVFQATWDRGSLYTFFADDPNSWDTPPGAEVRFFYGSPGAEQTLRYPVFLGQPGGQDPTQLLPLDVSLDPFHPWNPGQTLFSLDVARFGGQGGPVLPTCTSLSATDGTTVTLVPKQGAGFALGMRPQGASTESAEAYSYLTMAGTFSVQAVEGEPTIRQVMCGLAGTEYLLLASGATFEFVPRCGAYAPFFGPPSGGDADPCKPVGGDHPIDPQELLAQKFTTAWLRAVPPAGPADETIDRGYAMQPGSSVLYTSGDSGYPLAVGCRMSTLEPVQESDPLTALPVAPYGQVWATGASALPSPDVLRAFESQVLEASRLAKAPKDETNGPTVFRVDSHERVDGGRVVTPDGLLATLNRDGQAGTFATLQLAKSPNTTPQPGAAELSFTGSPVITPELTYALMNDGLFMVATDAHALGGIGAGFKNVIEMGEWTFDLDVGHSTDQGANPKTILVFKFTTGFTLIDLVANTAYWQGWQTFIGGDDEVKVVQSQLNTMLCAAKPSPPAPHADGDSPDPETPSDLFADFWSKATDPFWTGIVAMNCRIEAGALPIDLQDLLGGIVGELRAHHFGITVNRVKGADSSSWTMDTSSLFALIHYEMRYGNPPLPPTQFNFQVLRLNVLFENSALTHFDSRIAVTIPKLFSTEVKLPKSADPNVPPGYNVIEIDGVYQRHGESGTVVFDTAQPQVFSFKLDGSGFRVLQEAYVTDAALVPIGRSTEGDTVTVHSCLMLVGTLLFTSDVSKPAQVRSRAAGTAAPPMDLFAYGDTTATPPAGLGFASYAIAMTTTITNNSGQLASIGPDLTQLRVTPASSQVRAGSLLAALPLRLTEFLLQPSSSGWNVSFDGASAQSFNAAYALRLQTSLGSLGALSSSSVGLDVDLILGWQAAAGADNDEVWLLMVPPTTMRGQLGFGIQGVLDTTFTGVKLVRAKWPSSGSPSWTVYAVYFLNVNVQLLGIYLLPGDSDFTLFADPSRGSASNIGWLMSLRAPSPPPRPELMAPENRSEGAELIPTDTGEVLPATSPGTGGITFRAEEFAFGQRIGLRTDTTKTTVIQSAIDQLTTVPGDLISILETLFGGDSKKPPFGYDPSADWLVGISLIYSVVTFDVLLVDGQFYGMLIKIRKKDPPPPASQQPFAGLSLEIIYRKVNDHLGEFSADLTLPSKYRKITLGADPDTTTITLPAVGIAIWTNGDFKVSIGWPLGNRSFNIAFPPNPIPWAGGGGLYFAKLRSEDAKGLGTNFDTILEFGIALRIGADTAGDWKLLSYAASLYLFGSFEGFLAWEKDHPISGGVDYYWFCATVGVQGHVEGTVDFSIIKVTVSLDATASATLAFETDHSSYAQIEFVAEVDASVEILFFTISFSFSIDLHTDAHFGSGDPADISGPTPPELSSRVARDGAVRPLTLAERVEHKRQPVSALAPASPIGLTAHFLLQPSVRLDPTTQKWKAVGVATLVLDRPPPGANGLGTDGFSQLLASLAAYLFQTYGGYTDPSQPVTAAEVNAITAAIDAGTFGLSAVYLWMGTSQVSFTITGAQPADKQDGSVPGVLLPMIPGLDLVYSGATTGFGDGAAPPGYVTDLADYFAKLSMVGDGKLQNLHAAAGDPPPPSPRWFPGLLFADAYNLVGKHVVQEIGGLANPGTLQQALQQVNVANVAGVLSRFLQNGLRLPDPAAIGPVESRPTIGLYALTGQQFDVAADEHGHSILTAQLVKDAPKVAVTIAGDGTAALPFALGQQPEPPPHAPAPMPRIVDVPVIYMLHRGFGWTQSTIGSSANWLLFDFPDQLQSTLRLNSPLTLKLSTTDGKTASPVRGTEGLMIRFVLSPIPGMGSGDKLAEKVFRVAGPDDATRDLIELLFASGDLSSAHLDLLLPAKDGSYTTSAADAAATILKTDLSTAGRPALTALFANMIEQRPTAIPVPALGPTSAPVTDATNFLRLLWECSIVHSGGFFLYVPDLDTSSGAASYQVAVLVTSTSVQPAPTLSVDAYHTTILVTASDVPPGRRVQAALFNGPGSAPITEPKPGYPPGTLAFSSSWSSSDSPPVPAHVTAAPTAEFAGALYQLMEFRLHGDTAIEPSAWSMPLGPNGDAQGWTYKRAVPVQRFVKGASDPPSRYAAIGCSTGVDLQLLDVFGNAYATSSMTMMAVYNDPLIPLDEWPGATAAYAFEQAAQGSATLVVNVSFELDDVDQPATALEYYRAIHDQLTDSRTTMSFTTAAAGGPVTMTADGGTPAQAALSKFVAEVIAALGSTPPAPAPSAVVLNGTIELDYISQIAEDMFPLWVMIELTREPPSESQSPAYPYPPGFLEVSAQIPLLLDPTAQSPEAALREWAIGLEQAFSNFDGKGAIVKVLAGKPPTKVTATRSRLGVSSAGAVTEVPGDVWALRWGPSAGVSVQFPNAEEQTAGAPAYFSAMPLSTQLMGGAVDIYSYDDSGNRLPQPKTVTVSGVDLDQWASSFLSTFDSILAPDLATAITRLNAANYAALMTAKEDLAFAIAGGTSWVFQDQMPHDGQPGVGDLDAAQLCLRESLLSALGADFATSAVVQLPATVEVHGPFPASDPAPRPPEVFGSPTPIVVADGGDTTVQQFTISSASLPLAAGAAQLTFLVGAANPTSRADLCLGFNYGITFVDHSFQTSEEQFGYVPSSWLRFVVPDVDPDATTTRALSVPMGQLDIPIPVRGYPSVPRLVRQSATAAHDKPTTLSDAVMFDYSLQLARPTVAQDDLHLSVLFNGADSLRAMGLTPAEALLGPLARFQDFSERYLPAALGAIERGDATAGQWLTDVLALVQDVATAWSAPGAAAVSASPGDGRSVPAPWTWYLRLQVPDETKPNVLLVEWVGDGDAPAQAWPIIEGTLGVPDSQGRMVYTLGPGANLTEPTLTWHGLSAITAQRITTEAWIVRNEALAGCGGQLQDREVNPALRYTTATVAFPDPVVPLLQVDNTVTLKTNSLADAVSQLVSGVMQPTTPASEVGWASEIGYEFAVLSAGPGEIRTRLPGLLARAQLTTVSPPPSGVDSIASLVAALKKQIDDWRRTVQLSGTAPALVCSLTIFAAGTNQSLVRVFKIEAPISGSGWWSS